MLLGTQDKDFFPKDMVEKFRFMKEMGFECFEIDGKVLVENLEEVKKAIKETGLPVCTAPAADIVVGSVTLSKRNA